MGNHDLTPIAVLPPALLQRRAIVYVRQSTQSQVMTNLESQRRQYDLVSSARSYGFQSVDVIDDDLGISASGNATRPGFERLVATLCSGEVGAVFCLEICGMVEARVVDHDGVYDPRLPNDRLLLGMKGSISEFELGILRTRMLDAAVRRPGAANCATPHRLATFGTGTPGSCLIQTCGFRR